MLSYYCLVTLKRLDSCTSKKAKKGDVLVQLVKCSFVEFLLGDGLVGFVFFRNAKQ